MRICCSLVIEIFCWRDGLLVEWTFTVTCGLGTTWCFFYYLDGTYFFFTWACEHWTFFDWRYICCSAQRTIMHQSTIITLHLILLFNCLHSFLLINKINTIIQIDLQSLWCTLSLQLQLFSQPSSLLHQFVRHLVYHVYQFIVLRDWLVRGGIVAEEGWLVVLLLQNTMRIQLRFLLRISMRFLWSYPLRRLYPA